MSLMNDVRSIWSNGFNIDLLRLWRRSLNRTATRQVRFAVEAAADELREWDGTSLPVEDVIKKWTDHEGAEYDQAVAYLATLGIGYLVALSPREREE